MKCDYCDYDSIYPQNLKRHLKKHLKNTEISEINKAKSVKSPEINKQPTLEHISDNIVRVDDHTDKDVLFDITDEVSRGARALNRVNKAIPQREMKKW